MEKRVRPLPESGFYIVSNGLPTRYHVERMGHQGYVVFHWLLKEQSDARGFVRGGALIPASEIAEACCVSPKTARQLVALLEQLGYIRVKARYGRSGGYRIGVRNQKKFKRNETPGLTSNIKRSAGERLLVEEPRETCAVVVKGNGLPLLRPVKGNGEPLLRVLGTTCSTVQLQQVSTTTTSPRAVKTPAVEAPASGFLTAPTNGKRPPGKNANQIVLLCRQFAAAYERVLGQPYPARAAVDRSVMKQVVRVYAKKTNPYDAVAIRLDRFWTEQQRGLQNDLTATPTARSKPSIPGFLNQLPNLDKHFRFDDNPKEQQHGQQQT